MYQDKSDEMYGKHFTRFVNCMWYKARLVSCTKFSMLMQIEDPLWNIVFPIMDQQLYYHSSSSIIIGYFMKATRLHNEGFVQCPESCCFCLCPIMYALLWRLWTVFFFLASSWNSCACLTNKYCRRHWNAMGWWVCTKASWYDLKTVVNVWSLIIFISFLVFWWLEFCRI